MDASNTSHLGEPSVEWLFNTGALKISSASEPFWYTSGEIGPYYINTHFLCGGEQSAIDVLDAIDREDKNPSTLPKNLMKILTSVYDSSSDFRQLIAALAQLLRDEVPLELLTGISGGQRRDWFFAPLVARELDKPCIYLYNDGRVFDQQGEQIRSLVSQVYVNVCDLLRVGSSYTTKWIPSIGDLGGVLRYSLSVVDRLEGGEENLIEAGVKRSLSLFQIDRALFVEASNRGLISDAQLAMVEAYVADPRGAMRAFLLSNPTFLKEALEGADQKKAQRAQLLLKENFYQLPEEILR